MGSRAALVPCKACQQPVARRSSTCPHCGRRRPAGGVPGWLFVGTVLVLVSSVLILLKVWAQVLG